jgi:hypothetical protein
MDLTISAAARCFRIHLAASRYNEHFIALTVTADQAARSRHLELMATCADSLSAASSDLDVIREWAVIAGLLRAVAASERGQVLTGLYITGDQDLREHTAAELDQWLAAWEVLSAERDRRVRAGILRELREAAITSAGVLVLDEIAATEELAARYSRSCLAVAA